MEDLITKELPLPSSLPEIRTICRVCQKQFAQYTCPRCNARYCSLPCYKGHSLRCTESFMRENVMEEMQQMQPDDEMRKKMLDILKRFHLEEEMDYVKDDDSELSEETIKKVLSGENLCFEDLSPEEMKRFRRAIASGELSKMIEPWEPWWLKPSSRTISLAHDGMALIKTIDTDAGDSKLEDDVNDVPAGPEIPLPPLVELSRAEPSPLLPIHLVDILFSYCFTLRLYNGDWHTDPLGATMVLLNISSILGGLHQPETVAEALGHCMEQTCSPTYKHAGGLQFGLGLLDDVMSLLSLGNNAIICLLCDLRRLVNSSEKMLKGNKMRKHARDENRTKLKRAERKLYYLMSWVHQQLPGVFSCTGDLVRMEKTTLSSADRTFVNNKGESKRCLLGKILIEEL